MARFARAAGVLALLLGVSVLAQEAPLPMFPLAQERAPYRLSSGAHDAARVRSPNPGFRATVRRAGATWMRLHFSGYHLGERSTVILTSLRDGARQRLDTESMEQWGQASAFFNGDAVEVALHVAPGDSGVFVEMEEIRAGRGRAAGSRMHGAGQGCTEARATFGAAASCDDKDERVRSNTPGVGRLVLQVGVPAVSLTADCTAWIIGNGALLTAGHCIDPDNIPLMVEFNVPDSQPDGAPVFAHPDDQYPIDPGRIRFDPVFLSLPDHKVNLGDDWGLFAAFPNSNTGRTAAEAEGRFFRLTNTTNFSDGRAVRSVGFGRDDHPPGPVSTCGDARPSSGYNADSQTQQTDEGFYRQAFANHHRVETDIAVGSSGSPLLDAATGVAFGITTHVSCGDAGLSQYALGQRFEASDLAEAIHTFPGPDTRYADAGHPEALEDGTLFRPYDTIPEALRAAPSGGIVSVAPGIYGEALRVDRDLTLDAPVGDVILKGDLIVQAGVTLTIAPGATLGFAPGKRILVYGTLRVEGSSSRRVTLTSSTPTGSWSGIAFANGSGGVVRYADLTRLTGGWAGSAIRISGSASPVIEYATIDVLPGSYVFGVASTGAYTYNNPKIYRSTVRSASGPALYVSGSGGYLSVHGSDIVQASPHPAIRAEHGGVVAAWIAATVYEGRNRIVGGRLYASDGGVINVGEPSGSKAGNHFCDTASATLEVARGGTIYALHDYWPGGAPPVQKNGGGTIYYGRNLGSADCPEPAGASLPAVSPAASVIPLFGPSGADAPPADGIGRAPNEGLGVSSYPNPFNPRTAIRYVLPEAGRVRLTVYDVLGREVAVLVEERRPAGIHEAVFEASHLPSGTYVYRLEATGHVRSGMLLLMK